jgi:hypothetical protein
VEDNRRIPIEIARYIKAGDKYVFDPEFNVYHGMALLNATNLLHPGALLVETSIPIKAFQIPEDSIGASEHGFSPMQQVSGDPKAWTPLAFPQFQ